MCLRYKYEYAARIATGAWKAKKHKAMAAEAQRAWHSLKKSNGGRAWMRHDAEPKRQGRAQELATSGKGGKETYEELLPPLVPQPRPG